MAMGNSVANGFFLMRILTTKMVVSIRLRTIYVRNMKLLQGTNLNFSLTKTALNGGRIGARI